MCPTDDEDIILFLSFRPPRSFLPFHHDLLYGNMLPTIPTNDSKAATNARSNIPMVDQYFFNVVRSRATTWYVCVEIYELRRRHRRYQRCT